MTLGQVRGEVHLGVLCGNGLESRCRVRVLMKIANDQHSQARAHECKLSVESSITDAEIEANVSQNGIVM